MIRFYKRFYEIIDFVEAFEFDLCHLVVAAFTAGISSLAIWPDQTCSIPLYIVHRPAHCTRTLYTTVQCTPGLVQLPCPYPPAVQPAIVGTTTTCSPALTPPWCAANLVRLAGLGWNGRLVLPHFQPWSISLYNLYWWYMNIGQNKICFCWIHVVSRN